MPAPHQLVRGDPCLRQLALLRELPQKQLCQLQQPPRRLQHWRKRVVPPCLLLRQLLQQLLLQQQQPQLVPSEAAC